jgi:Zn-finger nucleic acid-binding protein
MTCSSLGRKGLRSRNNSEEDMNMSGRCTGCWDHTGGVDRVIERAPTEAELIEKLCRERGYTQETSPSRREKLAKIALEKAHARFRRSQKPD